MAVTWTLILNGLANGALYFLMAAGLTLIFGLLRVINFAHGGFFIWGAYVGTFFYTTMHSFIVALVGGLAIGAVIGYLSERGLVARIYGEGTQQLLITMGILIVLAELIKLPFGNDPVGSSMPFALHKSWMMHGVVIVEYNLFIMAVGVLVYLILLALLYRTRLGTIIRAGVYNPELVEARGIPIRRVFTAVFTLGAALAGFAGALAGPYYGSVTPSMGMDMELNAFIIVVLGGLGSLNGSLVGSLLVGLATSVVSFYAPSFAVLVAVAVMAAVLLVRPNGLFGEKEAA